MNAQEQKFRPQTNRGEIFLAGFFFHGANLAHNKNKKTGVLWRVLIHPSFLLAHIIHEPETHHNMMRTSSPIIKLIGKIWVYLVESEGIIAKTLYHEALKTVLYNHLGTTRNRLELSQAKMSEILLISPRSYIELEHGNSLCCTLVFALFVTKCCDNPAGLLDEIKQSFAKVDASIE